jgi:hypothetical protein
MALRWAAAGPWLEAARTQFRRINGYRQLPQLAALEAATADQPDLLDLRVTAS